MGHLDWMDDAACREYPLETFYPERDELGASKQAKEICARCPVRLKCLAWILSRESQAISYAHGVCGGMAAYERQRLLRAAKGNVVVLPGGGRLTITR